MARWGLLGLALIVSVGCKRDPDVAAFQAAAGELHAIRAKAIALDLPVEPKEFNPVTVAPDQNAAAPYQAAIKSWRSLSSNRQAWESATDRVSRNNASPQDLAVYNKAKSSFAPVLSALRLAATYQQLDRDLDYVKLNYTSDRENDGLYSTTQLVGASAIERARSGDREGMRADLEVFLRMAQHSGDEPRLAGMLSQVSLTRNYVRTALACLHACQGDPNIAREILASQAVRPVLDFKKALRGELAANIGLMRALGTRPNETSKILDATGVAELIGVAKAVAPAGRITALNT